MGHTVLLTFDDGPHQHVTPLVLDRLERFGARAVFFVVGRRIEHAPHVLREIRRRGHLLGNHSHSHSGRSISSDGAVRGSTFLDYYRDTQRCQELIERHAGHRPVLFRPPEGRLTPMTLLVPPLLGLRCVTWSQDVGDWRFRSARQAGAGGETLAAAAGPGDIILLHDDNPCLVDLLDVLLPALTSRKFDLASGVSHLTRDSYVRGDDEIQQWL